MNDEKLQKWQQIEKFILTSSNRQIDTSCWLDYKYINNNNELNKYSDYSKAAHALIWSPSVLKFNNKDLKAAILMQMRFDGCIGFPGGFIDETDESIEFGLNRELNEEIHLDKKYYVTKNDHLFTQVNDKAKIVLFFYGKKVSYDEFYDIEKTCLKSHDWGSEVMGILRPPLFRLDETSDRGFQRFIKNKFIGNSLVQLLMTTYFLDILDANEIISAFK